MTSNTRFALDANVFIESHRRYYSFDIVPSFWSTLLKLAEEGRIVSIDRIKTEIDRGNKDDNLKTWANTEFSEWFMSTDDERVFKTYGQILDWVSNQNQYLDYAKTEFAGAADSWLVAYAKTYNYSVVTHEQFNPDIRKRILIPNVCTAFKVPFLDTFEMLRELNVKLG